jgi:hypothetical protein
MKRRRELLRPSDAVQATVTNQNHRIARKRRRSMQALGARLAIMKKLTTERMAPEKTVQAQVI